MSRPLTATQLARLWQQSATPVVLLDEQRQVTWANQALADWLSQTVEQIVGQVWPFADTSSALAPDPCVSEGVIQTHHAAISAAVECTRASSLGPFIG